MQLHALSFREQVGITDELDYLDLPKAVPGSHTAEHMLEGNL